MLWLEILKTAFSQLQANRMRSFLTTLGIIIGVGTVILIVAILEGYRGSLEKDLNILGANTFQVQRYEPVMFGASWKRKYRKPLSYDLVRVIKESCPSVQYVGAQAFEGGVLVQYRDRHTNPNVMVSGATPDYPLTRGYFVADGHFFSDRDVRSHAKVAVLGYDVVQKLFPHEDPLGKFVVLKGNRFRVIGVFEKQGSSTFGQSRDNIVVIPITTWHDLFGKTKTVMLLVMAKSAEVFQTAQDEVIGVLRRVRKVPPGKENDFAIVTNESLITTFNKTAGKIRMGGILLGVISLLVGGIGVMNIMLVSVTERTREIGVRRAVGARRLHIFNQFIMEATLLCLIGGLIGLTGGVLLSLFIAAQLGWPVSIPTWAWLSALVTTTVVGVASGFYPAFKAAYLNVIDALRYE